MNIDKDINRCKELIKTEHSNWIGMSNQDAISNVLSELETWKKIADILAEECTMFKKIQQIDLDNEYSNGLVYMTKEEVLDWAKREVENG